MDGNYPQRGVTIYKKRAQQGRDFSGLRYANISPTDIDAFIEYHDKCYVFIEAKMPNAAFPHGQKLALERLCDDLQKIKPTLLILMSHETPVEEEIDFANARVEKYRYKGYWKIPGMACTVREFLDSFLKAMDKKRSEA